MTFNGQTYEYLIETQDGREWKQDIMENGSMTFDVRDYWHLREFVPHRALREEIIKLLANSITKIEANFFQ